MGDLATPSYAAIEYAIAVHGGAGKAPTTDEWRHHREEVLRQALKSGSEILKQGGTSLDAVETVIRILEDSPYFNAGKGAVFNQVGTHELDASIMDGRTRACGGVGGVRTIRHPISLARLVMTETKHVLLVTDGAEKFADRIGEKHNIERVENSYFSTDHQRRRLHRVQAESQAVELDSKGTVGCVALDRHGDLAAGTSTGGLTNKRFGRIGDSPIVGAGTFADNKTCAVSCTGIGEDFIRNAVAFDVSARMLYRGDTVKAAVHSILHDPNQTVRGGIIAVGHNGEITMQFNTEGMARAAADSDGRFEINVAE
jgi:beta-aspartyl-peptidase (threonine type)